MAFAWPPQMELARQQLAQEIEQVDQKKVDPTSTPWGQIEKSVIKLLGGAFAMNKAEHQAVAMGLSAFFAARLEKDVGAFWFVNRESIEGAVLGFPEALIMLSPLGAVVQALTRANLARLDEIEKDIRNSLAQVKFSAGPAAVGQARFGP